MRARHQRVGDAPVAGTPGVGKRYARLIVHRLSQAFDAALFAALFLMLVVGLYALWDANAVYRAADATRWQAYMPTDADHGSYDELVVLNSDVVGWINIYGTHINYPLVQGKSDFEYLNKDASGTYSLSGSLFLDSRCSAEFRDFNTIIYGHHMDRDAMFGEIGNFADAKYFDAREYGTLYVGKGSDAGKIFGLHIVAFVPADAYDGTVYRPGVEGATDQQAYFNHVRAQATLTRPVDVDSQAGERVVLLSTCSDESTNARSIVVAKIEQEVHEDTFKEEVRTGVGIDIPEGWLDFPWLGWAALVTLLALLLAFILRWAARRKARATRGAHFAKDA
ncbi:class B sortase [Collinsella sp. AGMB00827]|uniref:Class B sortase n=1 Tax=Collinsella ureilytica TaxID=2869515 RepID=A0ABS7MID6_9ACTN|nr:class B sortase [Collinsella urealyticum]MBY4797130.1 class B sortase [Collinsella urealyticum]